MFTIAVQPDRVEMGDGVSDSYSTTWIPAIRAAGHRVQEVDLRANDILQRLRGCDALMWRFAQTPADMAVARRLLPVVEGCLGLYVFPDRRTCWHFDDKLAQWYLLRAAGLPMPRTWIFWRRDETEAFCRTAAYPLVAKLSAGASSENVRLIHNAQEALRLVERMFVRGANQRNGLADARPPWQRRVRNAARRLLRGLDPPPGRWWELQKDYVYFQEFLPDNPYTTRVNVVGNVAFHARRFNWPGDFRAGDQYDRTREAADSRFIRLAFRAAKLLGMQTCALDWLIDRQGEPCISEVSYTIQVYPVFKYPGRWELQGDAETGELTWYDGREPRLEQLQVQQMLRELERRKL